MIGNLESGGVSKGMVNLLHAFDKERYDVTLWMGSPTGLYRDMVPDHIRLISDDRNVWALQGLRGLIPLLGHGHFYCCMLSVFRLICAPFSKSWAGWILSRILKPIEEEFDAVVDYNGQHQLYFMVDKLKAKKKITFFHSDYSKWSYYRSMDARYFPKVDAICSISPHCVSVLKETFPDCAHKMELVEIISAPAVINCMAEEEASELSVLDHTLLSIVTVGHVCQFKGSDLAIEAAALMKSKGLRFQWFFIGGLEDKQGYAELVQQHGVQDCINFLGLKRNPYPYLKKAVMVVHPSQFEGKSIALDEAKILCKPVVVTNFSTVHDQFEHGVNANICEMTAESLADAIMDLWAHPDKRERYSAWLKEHMTDNSHEVEKLYQLIES